jgi:4-amino-4-deoxy-L-arabinose transferase-like glycosyltransferase
VESAGTRGAGERATAAVAAPSAADAAAAAPAPPGPLRLVAREADLRGLLGVELIPALVIGLLAVVLTRRRSRSERAGALFVATWLLTAGALLSFLPDLKVRYADVLAPPVALALGVGIVALSARLPRVLTAALVMALLAAPAVQAVDVVRDGASDSGHLGALSAQQAQRLSAFLARRTKHSRYELASATAAKAAPLIERDARPVLMLGTELGKPLTSLKRLRSDVQHGEVRYVLMAGRCGPHTATTPTGCGAAARWARVHGRDVSRAAGLNSNTLYAVRATHPRLSTRRYPRRHRCHSRSSSSTTSRRCVRR